MLGSQARKLIAIVFVCLLTMGVGRGQGQQERDRQDAERLWEAIVRTKGGRECLHGVQSLLIQEKNPVTAVMLYVFPDKYWDWIYEKPLDKPVMGFYKGEGNVYYAISSGRTEVVTDAHPREYMEAEAVTYLLETKWFRPEPVRVTRKREGKRTLEILETRLNDERFDFAVETETLLVESISRYSQVYKGAREPWRVLVFSDYAEVDGILMPRQQAILYNGKLMGKRPMAYAFNVEYDPHFFDAPPPLSAGKDAWKPKN
jgi:hypothetical protein